MSLTATAKFNVSIAKGNAFDSAEMEARKEVSISFSELSTIKGLSKTRAVHLQILCRLFAYASGRVCMCLHLHNAAWQALIFIGLYNNDIIMLYHHACPLLPSCTLATQLHLA